jgi:hypothetical protein
VRRHLDPGEHPLQSILLIIFGRNLRAKHNLDKFTFVL